jgi:hypothetical protein
MVKMSSEHVADPKEALAKFEAQRSGAKQGYHDILNQRGNRLFTLDEKSGPQSRTYRDVEHELSQHRAEFERIKTAVRRPLNKWHVRGWLIVLVGVVLALLEAPVNKFLFDVALQSSSFASYTISIMFASVLLILAHVCGRSLRQIWSDYRKRVVWSSLLIFLLTLLVLTTLVSILTVARASFAANTGSIQDLLQGVKTTVGSIGLWRILVGAFSEMSALVLATINIGGIFMTMMLAFFTHDPDKDFDQVARSVESEKKKLDKIHTAYIEAKTAIIKDLAPDLAGFGANFKTANMGVIEYKRRLGYPLDAHDHEVIDELDQMSEDAERARANEWASAGPDPHQPVADRPPPPLRAIDGERRQAGGERG